MKKFLMGLAVLFVLATKKDEIKALNKSFEKPPEPDWTEKQLAAIARIKELYEADTPKEHQGGYLEDEKHHSTLTIAKHRVSALNTCYQSNLKIGEMHLDSARSNEKFQKWLTNNPHTPQEREEADDLPTVIEAQEEISMAESKLLLLQDLCVTLDINFNDFTHPDRDKALHRQFGLE